MTTYIQAYVVRTKDLPIRFADRYGVITEELLENCIFFLEHEAEYVLAETGAAERFTVAPVKIQLNL